MADTSDVENALVALIGGVVYPNGAASPSIAATQVQLASAVAAGAQSASLSSAAGLSAGLQIAFYGGTFELATVAASYVEGSTTVPLAAPLGAENWTGLVNAHASGSTVTWNDAVEVFRGWPVSDVLNTILAAGLANVSVFPPPGMERNTTRWPREEQLLTPPVHTLSAEVLGNVVTLGGTIAVPQNVIVICNQILFAYGVKANDTLGSIAASLAGLIATQFPGSSASGSEVTIAGHPGIAQARIASTGQIYVEQSRQEKSYWITCWCPTPAMRDVLAPAIDVALKQLDFITVGPEQSLGRLRYVNSNVSDEGQKVQIYRRDLVYWVEYGTGSITSAFETGVIELLGIVPPLPPPPPGGGLSLDFSDPDNLVLNVSL